MTDRIDGGGLAAATPVRAGARAGSWTDLSTFFGGLNAGLWPGRDNMLVSDVEALQAIVLPSGLASPEIASPGVALVLVPRRPGASRHGAVDLSFAGAGMISSNDQPGAPSIERLRSFGNLDAQFGGPLRNRLGMFVSGSTSAIDRDERGQSVSPSESVDTFNGHIVANPTDRSEVRGLFAVQHSRHEYAGRAQFLDRDVGERDTSWQSQMIWDRQGSRGSLSEISIGYEHQVATPLPGSAVGGVMDRVLDGPILAPAEDRTADRFQAGLLFEPREARGPLGGHGLRFGLTMARNTWNAHVVAAPVVAETVNGLPARIWVPSISGVNSDRHANEFAFYVDDRIVPAGPLTIDLGLRAGVSAGSAQGAPTSVSWPVVLPRASVRWAPGGWAFFGGFARYQPELSPDVLAFGDPGEPFARVYRWNDANLNARLDPGETGTLVALAGGGQGVGSIDPDLHAPETNEFLFGADRRLSPAMTLAVVGTIRRERSIVQSVNTGAPASSYRVIFVPDQGLDYDSQSDNQPLAVYDRLPSSFGQDHFMLTNPPDDTAWYHGLEVSWRWHSTRWDSLAVATGYRAKGEGGNRGFRVTENDQGVIGEVFENPNASINAGGELFFDRGYMLKWSTTYHAPHDILAAVNARYQDGQPFSRLVIVPDLAQGPEIVQAYPSGHYTHFTFEATVDLRVEKGFRIGGKRASLRVDVFNLTNRANEIEENVVTGPLFRTTTAVQPPRTVRAGLRFEF
jgi:hypothetical protein